MKRYHINYNVGKVKYVVNYHNGEKFYPDNSRFYDIALFSNRRKMNSFIKELKSEGYIHILVL